MLSRLLLRLAAFSLILMPMMGIDAHAAVKPQPRAAARAGAARPAARPGAVDWTRTVTVTPIGSFILGNPNAKTKLVEYMSYSCPHCADFAAEATTQLKTGWVKGGSLSIEYRNFIRDGYDLSAALIARCGGTSHFLANHELIFSTYDGWMDQAQKYAQSHSDASGGDNGAQFIDIADKVGLTAVAVKNGISEQAAHQCLADPKALATILALTSGAWDVDRNFEGTPTFLLNGEVLHGIHSWEGLKPRLPPLPASGK